MTSFSASLGTSVQTVTQPQFTKVIFTAENYDLNGSYNTSTGEATVSEDNIYDISVGITFHDRQVGVAVSRRNCGFRVMNQSGSTLKQLVYIKHGYYTTAADNFNLSNSYQLRAGDKICVEYFNPYASEENMIFLEPYSWFSINKC